MTGVIYCTVPVPKKGDKTVRSNCQGISLLLPTHKILIKTVGDYWCWLNVTYQLLDGWLTVHLSITLV
jgi:hypothetical protein